MQARAIHLTRQGFERLTRELNHLQTVERPRIVARLQDSWGEDGEGDETRSEQGFVEGRIRELRATLLEAQIFDAQPGVDVVALGSRVSVVDETGDELCYTIVGPVEADPRHGLISDASPVGHALIGKCAGETAVVVAPGGTFDLFIVEIS
jgi:transcription elongation factor GreA